MRALAASFVVVVASLLTLTAHADVDLVVHDRMALPLVQVSEETEAGLIAAAPARPTPLKIRLDDTGHLELLLRVQPDLFLGKLVLAL